jgi:hypothetical protein
LPDCWCLGSHVLAGVSQFAAKPLSTEVITILHWTAVALCPGGWLPHVHASSSLVCPEGTAIFTAAGVLPHKPEA